MKRCLAIILSLLVIGGLVGSAYWSYQHHAPSTKSTPKFIQICDKYHLYATQSLSHEDNLIGVQKSYVATDNGKLQIEYFELDTAKHAKAMQNSWNTQYRLAQKQIQSNQIQYWHNSRFSIISEQALLSSQSVFFYAHHNNKVLYASGKRSDFNRIRQIANHCLA